jgi:hypothetical protein
VLIGFVFALIWIFSTANSPGTADALNGWQLVLILVASVFATSCPVVVFALISNWNFASSTNDRLRLRRWTLSLLGVEVLSILGVVLAGLTTHVALWLPVTLVVLGVIFTIIGLLLGRALRSRLLPTQPAPAL